MFHWDEKEKTCSLFGPGYDIYPESEAMHVLAFDCKWEIEIRGRVLTWELITTHIFNASYTVVLNFYGQTALLKKVYFEPFRDKFKYRIPNKNKVFSNINKENFM